jgi:glyoxylase-like metal-dependent hydrolase (beta-lactamase superfamily II)
MMGVTLVDTGFRGHAKAILGELRDLGYGPGDVRTIVLTHGDGDHKGNVAALKEATGARVAIHEADAPGLSGEPYQRAAGISAVLFSVLARVMKTPPVHPDISLHDGDVISGFRVHHLPGHTVGSIVLERDDGLVFSGDTLNGDAHGKPRAPTKALACDYGAALDSAAKIEALGYTLLLPGHGEPVRVERAGA